MGGLALIQNGDQVIEALGLQGQTFANAMQQLAIIPVFNLGLSWVGLLFQQRRLKVESR